MIFTPIWQLKRSLKYSWPTSTSLFKCLECIDIEPIWRVKTLRKTVRRHQISGKLNVIEQNGIIKGRHFDWCLRTNLTTFCYSGLKSLAQFRNDACMISFKRFYKWDRDFSPWLLNVLHNLRTAWFYAEKMKPFFCCRGFSESHPSKLQPPFLWGSHHFFFWIFIMAPDPNMDRWTPIPMATFP